jgi:hypothetical protein
MTTTEDENKTDMERRDEAIRVLEENPLITEWSPSDKLTDKMIQEYISDRCHSPDLTPECYLTYHLDEQVFDLHFAYCDDYNARQDHAWRTLECNGFTEEEIGAFFDEEESFDSCCPLDPNVGHFLDQDVNVRFELVSNYDCMNSAWFESDAGRRSFPTEHTDLGDVL